MIIYQCFLDIFLVYLVEPNVQVHQKSKREFCVEMLCLREVILHSQTSTKLRHFHSLFIIAIDKSFENSIENILNHPYLYRVYVSCINIELLSV